MNTDLHVFRLATENDKAYVLSFLEQYWNPNHIYIKHISLFEYDLVYNQNLHFILALNANNEIDGVLGFILYSPEFKGADIFTVLWKVKPKNGDPMLGISLLTNLINDFGFRIVSTVGANPRTLPLYEYAGYRVGQLKHYYMLNNVDNFKIALNTNAYKAEDSFPFGENNLIELKTFEELISNFYIEKYKNRIPYKSPWYINKRYFNHPVYKYRVLGVRNNSGVINSIIIARVVKHVDSSVMRIVDFIGDQADFSLAGAGLRALLNESTMEYIDFYQYGINDQILHAAGFTLKDHHGDLIIPNYFEPFSQENIVINYFTTATDDFYIFKGDGDQDRPNKIA